MGASQMSSLSRWGHVCGGFIFTFEKPADNLNCMARVLTPLQSKYLMNMSGSTAQQLAKRYPSMLTSRRLLVVHDETELKPGQTATRFGGSLKGHNGLRDIAARLKDNRDWHRFRVGIGKPERGSSVTLAEWCLGPCFRDELEMCGQDGAVTQAAWQAVQEILLFQQK